MTELSNYMSRKTATKMCDAQDHTLDPVVARALDRAVLETTRGLARAAVLAAAKKRDSLVTVTV